MDIQTPPDPTPTVQVAGYFGASIHEDIVPEQLVLGGRVGRGPIAGVVEGRVGLAPEQKDMLAWTISQVFFDRGPSPYASITERGGGAVALELGVPTFGARFSGGPFVQLGVDGGVARVVTFSSRRVDHAEDQLLFGARIAAGASWCLGRNAGVRLQLTDVVRPASVLSATGAPVPGLTGDLLVTLSVYAGR